MARKPEPRTPKPDTNNIYAVILVGGIGKRLQPLSKPSRPKPFLSVTKDRKTIFAKTIARIRQVLPMGNIIVVANKRQAQLIKKSSPKIVKGNLLLEKTSRNTAPAIALASLELRKRSADAVIVVLPADHYIGNEKVYLHTLKKGIEFVGSNPRALITVGLKPSFPATGYGYIKIAHGPRSTVHKDIYKVARFVEKPGIEAAQKFIDDGSYLWNTGTFIFKAVTFLGAVRRLAKGIYEPLKDMRKIEEKYDLLPNISVDYAIMEKAYEIYCVKGSYKWEDIGSFDSLKKVLRAEGRRFVERDGKVTKII